MTTIDLNPLVTTTDLDPLVASPMAMMTVLMSGGRHLIEVHMEQETMKPSARPSKATLGRLPQSPEASDVRLTQRLLH